MTNKKNIIIHTGNISVGGQEKMMIEFLKILSPEKYNITLLIEEDKDHGNHYEKYIPNYVKYYFLTSKEFIKKLLLQKHNKTLLNKVLYSINLKRKKSIAINNLNKYIKEADLIIDYDLGLLRTLHKVKLHKNIPIIGWSHLGNGKPLKNKQKEKNMLLYNTIVTINETMKNGFIENYGHKGVNIVKIGNFIDEDLILEKSKDIISENNLGNFILSIGALTERKNFSQLIETFHSLITQYNLDTNLVILGEGPQRNSLETLIKELNLTERVFLLGKKLNPYPYIAKCEFFVLPSLEEGFPVVLMEAMTLGKMIFAKNNSGNDEVLSQGQYGILSEDINKDFPSLFHKALTVSEYKINFEKLSKKRSLDFYKENAKFLIESLIDKCI
ncbi:MAG: glycosyltransferase [Cetobacterium sp.]